jgi:transglycosylase-like protein with SLT domain
VLRGDVTRALLGRWGRRRCSRSASASSVLILAVLFHAASALAEPAATGSTPSSQLLQLLQSNQATRDIVRRQLADAEAALSDVDTGSIAAQAELATRQASEADAKDLVARTTTRLAEAEEKVRELSASSQTLQAALLTTPVAYPPPKGHQRTDEAATVRKALNLMERVRDDLSKDLRSYQRDADLAVAATAKAAEGLAGNTASVPDRQARVDALRAQLVTVDNDSAVTAALARGLSSAGGPTVSASALAFSDIPADYLAIYVRSAATCAGLSWSVLAAIGSVESSHGRSNLPGVHSGVNLAGAMGPMQFLGATWGVYGSDGDGDGRRDVYNPKDAVLGAARYLCANGAGDLTRLRGAVWDYNHADWYVQGVLELASRYLAADRASGGKASSLLSASTPR